MRRVFTLLAVLVLAACDRSGFGTAGHATAVDSVRALNTQLAHAHTVSAQQDSLMQGFTETTKLLDSIDSELSHVKGLKSHVPLAMQGDSAQDPKAAYRANLLGKVKEATALLSASRARVRRLASNNSALQGQVDQYQQTITSLQAMVDRQKQDILVLTGRVDSLTTANTQLAAGEAAATDTMHTLRRENNTVYYVIGTKNDLEKRGIVVEEGSKFLFFGHHALVPARKLDPSVFTAIDKFSTTTITIPNPDRGYKIVSRQDPSLVDQPLTSAGKPSGELHIADPTQFWSTSKYLIIIAG
jgi:hypothetical protein